MQGQGDSTVDILARGLVCLSAVAHDADVANVALTCANGRLSSVDTMTASLVRLSSASDSTTETAAIVNADHRTNVLESVAWVMSCRNGYRPGSTRCNPGPGLAAVLATIDRTRLGGSDTVSLLAARGRCASRCG